MRKIIVSLLCSMAAFGFSTASNIIAIVPPTVEVTDSLKTHAGLQNVPEADFTKKLENVQFSTEETIDEFISWANENRLSNLTKTDLENILKLLDNNIDFAKKVALSTKEIQQAVTPAELAVKLNLPANPTAGSLTLYEARVWYSWQKATIKDMLDKTKSLEEQAIQAFTMRNEIKTTTRDIMKDRDIADFLNKSEPNKTWEDIVTNTTVNKGLSGNAVWEEIIESSMRGRAAVDTIFQIPIKK
ncbi:MAG: hypothetical protein FWC39_04165 [Bacteroidetes bacterium]|nr:hypothetical protein [Bacteroidota bacterium]